MKNPITFCVWLKESDKPYVLQAESLLQLASLIPPLIGLEEKASTVRVGEIVKTETVGIKTNTCFCTVYTKTKNINFLACFSKEY